MRNWTIKEAVETIREGTDFAGMKEIASFNPVFFKAVCENNVAGIANLMGEKFTLRRLNREAINDVDEDGDEEVTEKATAKSTKSKAAVADKPLEEMSTKELMALCDERGIKVPKYGKNKAFYLDALAGSDDADEAEDGDDEETNPYEGKNAMSLYKMCKDRGIKCEARQKSKVYIDLLVAADNADGEDVEDEDESWADEAEDEKSAKNAKNTKSKAADKSNKKAAVAAAEDDEEWDI